MPATAWVDWLRFAGSSPSSAFAPSFLIAMRAVAVRILSQRTVMKRRDFITLLGSAAVFGAFPVRAQRAGPIPRVGIIWIAPESVVGPFYDAFRDGLREMGYVESRNGRRHSQRFKPRIPI